MCSSRAFCVAPETWKGWSSRQFATAIRTMAKNLEHRPVVNDATRAGNAGADYVLMFRRDGENAVPIEHPSGLTEYAGEPAPDHEVPDPIIY